MCENDNPMRAMLNSAEFDAQPNAGRVQAVREQTLKLATRSGTAPRRVRRGLAAVVLVLVVTGVGLSTTQAGRDLLRQFITPIDQFFGTDWVSPEGDIWSLTTSGREEPYSPEEKAAIARRFSEINEIRNAGGGRLVGLIETPGLADQLSHTSYRIEYTLSSGETTVIGSGRPVGRQAKNLRIDEIMKLRDAGAGEVLSERPFEIGLGYYTIRLTLSDGQYVDLETHYPPSTREQRDRIFEEMRQLKGRDDFKVLFAEANPEEPQSGVWGILQYTLADGRVVGATERIPDQLISEDGQCVVMPGADESIAIRDNRAD